MNTNINSALAANLSFEAFAGETFDPAKMDEAEEYLCKAIRAGEFKSDPFAATIAGQMADEVSLGLFDKTISELSTQEKILLLDKASQIGREELTSIIISFLSDDIKMHASNAMDFVCTCE